MWSAIAPHLTPVMRYKLPVEFHAAPFIDYPAGEEKLIPLPALVRDVTVLSGNPAVYQYGWSKTGHHITTTTGNFMARNTLVRHSIVMDHDEDSR